MIDTTPLDEALVTLRSLLPWLHESHAERTVAEAICRLDAWGTELRRTTMETIPVESSNVEAMQYDEPTQTLVVHFRKGGVYHYAGVPRRVIDGLIAAPSKGSYLHGAIKPHFAATKQPTAPTPLPDTPEEQAALAEEREGISDALAEMGDESQDYYSLAESPR